MIDFIDRLFFDIDVYEIAVRGFLSNFVVAIAIALALFPVAKRLGAVDKKAFKTPVFLALLVMATFGALVGYSGGNSRDGVVGDLIPAVITFVAGGVTYLVGVRDSDTNPLTLPMVAAFVLGVFFCYILGAGNRVGFEATSRTRTICTETYSNAGILVDAEAWERMRGIFDQFCERPLRLDRSTQ